MSRNALSELKTLLRFPFQGPDWANRFIVGSALLFAGWVVPLLPVLFVYGYAVELMRRVMQGEDPELPPWQDWGRLFTDGLRAFVVAFVYLLPGTVLYFGGIGFYYISFFLMAVFQPQDPPIGLFLLAFAVLFLGFFLGSLFYLLGGFPLPAALAQFVTEDRLAAAFHFRRWWTVLRKRGWEYLAAWLLLLGIAVAAYLILMLPYYTVCLCWLVPFLIIPVAFYLTVVAAALFGIVWREYQTQS